MESTNDALCVRSICSKWLRHYIKLHDLQLHNAAVASDIGRVQVVTNQLARHKQHLILRHDWPWQVMLCKKLGTLILRNTAGVQLPQRTTTPRVYSARMRHYTSTICGRRFQSDSISVPGATHWRQRLLEFFSQLATDRHKWAVRVPRQAHGPTHHFDNSQEG